MNDNEGMKKRNVDYSKEIPFIRRRCPHLKGKELEEAEERFRQYVELCLKIYRRLEKEKNSDDDFDENTDRN